MERAVEKSEQAEHAAEVDEPVLAGEFPQRRDGKSDEEKNKRPVAGGVRDELDGIGA